MIDICATEGEHVFFSCLTEYIPSMQNRPNADKTLYASAYGSDILSIRAEQAEARRVFIAGDSTVADQYAGADYDPANCYAGWGQMLSCFLRRDAMCNMAHSGLTGRCFIEDGHFNIVKKYMRSGDLLLIQFGHNDQKRRELQPHKLYTKYLEDIIDGALALGAQPVLLSPISRVPSKDAAGCFDLLKAHAEAVGSLAEKRRLPFVDIHTYTFEKFCAMGEDCRSLFKDMTHTNDLGAFDIARFVAENLSEMGLAEITLSDPEFLLKAKSEGNQTPAPAPLPVPYVDIEDVQDKRLIYGGVQSGLLDPCVLHMHPFEPLSRAEFIQKLFRAAGLQGIATDGLAPYKDILPREFDASYAAACQKNHLVEGDYYRPDDMITADEANELCQKLNLRARIKESPALPDRYTLLNLLLDIKHERTNKDNSASHC